MISTNVTPTSKYLHQHQPTATTAAQQQQKQQQQRQQQQQQQHNGAMQKQPQKLVTTGTRKVSECRRVACR
jgi:hypothetical protein